MAGGYQALGSALAGGGVLPAAYAEAQGEQLGASTQNAITQAQEREMKIAARKRAGAAAAALPGSSPEMGAFAGTAAEGEFDPQQFVNAIGTNQKNAAGQTVVDPNSTDQQVARALLLRGNEQGIIRPTAQGEASTNVVHPEAGVTPTAYGAPVTASKNAVRASQAGLNDAHADYYSRSPGIGMGGPNAIGDLDPALQAAVSEQRLDPAKLNSRTVRIYEQLARSDPTLDFNLAHGGAQAAANVPFAQKRAVLAALPGNIHQMVDLGTKLNYPDVKFLGDSQKWLMGQNNDPDLTAYMGVRNDTLMNLAQAMRGVGMSNMAHTAEIEAANPTMSPRALSAWANEQIALVNRRAAQYESTMHPNIHPKGGAPAPAPAPGAAAAPAAAGTPSDQDLINRYANPK